MTQAWQRARLAEVCADAGLEDHEHYFLQSAIRLADTSGVLADNALALRTASFAVPWAGSLSVSYQNDQPRWAYVRKALQSAVEACNRLISTGLSVPTALNWRQNILPILSASNGVSAPRLIINTTEVENHQVEMCALALSTIAPVSSLTVLDLLASEVAVGLITHAADIDELLQQAKNINPKKVSFREQLAHLLSCQDISFNVLVPIGGARKLESLNNLNSLANVRQVRSGGPGKFNIFGNAGAAVGQFVDDTQKSLNHPDVPAQFRRQRIVLNASVQACDVHAAALVGRRTIAEVLDQYVAGHPFVQFEIDDIVGVSRSDKSWVQRISLKAPIEKSVRPLAVPWPDALRESMRVSHLLRDSIAPMTRVALAWVMIESTGLKPSNIDAIGKTLALETLRQQLFMPYRFLVQDAINREPVRYYKQRANVRFRKARSKWREAQGSDVPAPVSVKLYRISKSSEYLYALYSLLAKKAEEESDAKRGALAVLDGFINPGVDASIGHRAYLASVADWIAFLEAGWETSSKKEAGALRSLLEVVGMPAKVSIRKLTQLVRSGPASATYLEESFRWLVDILNAFYSARNLNLHRGIFSLEVDVAFGDLAVLVSDALFEIWAMWYSDAVTTSQDVSSITMQIASRYDWILSHLNNGGLVTSIDVDSLTAPGWSP